MAGTGRRLLAAPGLSLHGQVYAVGIAGGNLWGPVQNPDEPSHSHFTGIAT